MNPFFFGRSQQPLFGIYHSAKGNERGAGVVLCPPMGQDYMRSHRALRQLALQLTKVGFHVLRFDFSGIGDSAGDNTVATLQGWQDDVATAIEELKDTAGIKTVSLVGLRIGASVACLASRQRDDVDGLVLWDPVVSGPEFVEELVALADTPGRAPADQTVGITGFALTPQFRRDLLGIDLAGLQQHAARRILMVASEERAYYRRLSEQLAQLRNPTQSLHIPSGANWDDAEQMGAVLLPQAIIQTIVGYLAQ